MPQPPALFWIDARQRLALYLELIRFHRPIGTLLLLWPALWALWLAADGPPPWQILLIFVLGVFLMRSAGCAINDYADRKLDGGVERTRNRPLATGRLQPWEALALFALLSLIAFALVLLLNLATILLSFVAVTLAALYPFMKRYTHLPQLFLGMAFGWAIPMAFTAVTNALPWQLWPLFLATLLWALIYDTEYAMVDRDDDLKIGIKSSAILFGQYDRLAIALLQAAMLALLLWVGQLFALGGWYYLGLTAALASALYQQWLIRQRQRDACFRAFLHNNLFGMAIFLGILLATL